MSSTEQDDVAFKTIAEKICRAFLKKGECDKLFDEEEDFDEEDDFEEEDDFYEDVDFDEEDEEE